MKTKPVVEPTSSPSPLIKIKRDAEGFTVRIAPQASGAVYVVCSQLVAGMPCEAVKFSEAGQSSVRVLPVQEFSQALDDTPTSPITKTSFAKTNVAFNFATLGESA